MTLIQKIKANKKTIFIGAGVLLALAALYMAYLYWRRNIKPQILSAPPKSAADEQAFNKMLDIIKHDSGPCSQTAELNKVTVIAGNDYTAGTVNSAYGQSKTGALMGAIKKRESEWQLEAPNKGIKITRGKWISDSGLTKCTNVWLQYKDNEPV